MKLGTSKKEFLYGDLTFKLRRILFDVHNELGRFAREKQYGDLVEKKLSEKGIKFERERRVGDTNNILDFIIESLIVLELKSKPFLTKEDYFQVQRYLQATNLRLGILVNFNVNYLAPKRVLNSHSDL
jgi:GxxExxY protein